ncbi:MAG: hypothetical protein KKF68_00935 [Nanoarchaeota archaeon]|nr:hypothetical protein [Nanoarchaeota archaeon]
MNEKVLIFDSSTLISFAMNGLFEEIKKLKSIFKGKFIITGEVKREIIDKPLTIKRFELEALRLRQLLNDKILEMPSSLGIDNKEISEKSQEFLEKINNSFMSKGRNLTIIDSGESTCLALSHILNKKKISNVIALDERTTRMICEKPENLKKLLQKKLHTSVDIKNKNFKEFKEFKIIRSSELIYVAYKKNLVNLKNGQVLDALLYAVKFKGCAISGDEIREIKGLK